jgi:uncharacterized RDD family membrane protein YckC
MENSPIEQLGSRQFCSECGRPYAPEDLVRFGSVVVCAECKPNYVQQMREGGAAASSVRYGGFWRRFVAILVDGILLWIVLLPLRLVLAPPRATAMDLYHFGFGHTFWATFWSWNTGIAYAVEFVYYVYFLSQKGATLGKMLMGVKVVTAKGGPISVGRAIGRYFARNLSWMTLFIGYIMAAFDDQKRALHDYICGTRVIRD